MTALLPTSTSLIDSTTEKTVCGVRSQPLSHIFTSPFEEHSRHWRSYLLELGSHVEPGQGCMGGGISMFSRLAAHMGVGSRAVSVAMCLIPGQSQESLKDLSLASEGGGGIQHPPHEFFFLEWTTKRSADVRQRLHSLWGTSLAHLLIKKTF